MVIVDQFRTTHLCIKMIKVSSAHDKTRRTDHPGRWAGAPSKRRDHSPVSMMFPAAVAVVDAELGVIVRLTSYIGGTPVQKYELDDLAALTGEFRVDLPDGLPVAEGGPSDDLRSPGPCGPPLTLGRVLARHAA